MLESLRGFVIAGVGGWEPAIPGSMRAEAAHARPHLV